MKKGTTGKTSAMGVSQSVPQSDLSPVLAKYKQYLQSCYHARVLAPADKYLPTLESPYINLAMIRRGRYNHKQRDKFTWQTLHGGVDQTLENKTPITIKDLLIPEDRGSDTGYQMRIKGSETGKSMVSLTTEDLECLLDFHSEFPQRFHHQSKFVGDIGRHTDFTAEGIKGPVGFILVEGSPGIGKSTFA